MYSSGCHCITVSHQYFPDNVTNVCSATCLDSYCIESGLLYFGSFIFLFVPIRTCFTNQLLHALLLFLLCGYVYHVDLFVVLRICYLFILMSCCFSLLHFFVFGSRSLEIRCMFLCVLYTVQNIISLLIIFYYHWFMFFYSKRFISYRCPFHMYI